MTNDWTLELRETSSNDSGTACLWICNPACVTLTSTNRFSGVYECQVPSSHDNNLSYSVTLQVVGEDLISDNRMCP